MNKSSKVKRKRCGVVKKQNPKEKHNGNEDLIIYYTVILDVMHFTYINQILTSNLSLMK